MFVVSTEDFILKVYWYICNEYYLYKIVKMLSEESYEFL